MQLSPVQLIAGSYVKDNGVAPAPAIYVETYGTQPAILPALGPVEHPAIGVYVCWLDAVSRTIKPGNIIKATPIGPAAKFATVEQTGDLATGPTKITVRLWAGFAPGDGIDGDFYLEITQLPSSHLL